MTAGRDAALDLELVVSSGDPAETVTAVGLFAAHADSRAGHTRGRRVIVI